MTDQFKERFEKFIEGAQEKVNKGMEKYPSLPVPEITYKINAKYIRVLRDTALYCFIDLEHGQIWKGAGWKTPEKKNPRGCIFNDDFGLSGVTEYGTTYLR